MKKYIEIVAFEKDEVVRRIDVTDKSDRFIARSEMGMNINLNHKEYYTREIESEIELKTI